MDVLGFIILILFSGTITVFNLLFIKRLKVINKNKAKHKLIYFFISIITLISTTFFYIRFQNGVLKNILHFNIDETTNGGILITLIGIVILNILLNIFISRIYFKKLNKIKEIESIGTE